MTGHKVVVKITDFGSEKHKPEGRVTEIIGHVNDPGTDILSIVRAYGLPEAFPQEVMEEIEDIPDHVSRWRWAAFMASVTLYPPMDGAGNYRAAWTCGGFRP